MGTVPANEPIGERRRLGVKCAIPDCEKRPVAKGFCPGHYKRLLLGQPLHAPIKRPGTVMHERVPEVKVPDYALAALRRRAKAHGIPVVALVRALIVRWAQTEGAQKQPETDATADAAWRHSGYDVRSGF